MFLLHFYCCISLCFAIFASILYATVFCEALCNSGFERHYKNTVVIIIVITLIIIMSAPLPESLSPEALLRLGLLGVEPEVPGAGSGGRR